VDVNRLSSFSGIAENSRFWRDVNRLSSFSGIAENSRF